MMNNEPRPPLAGMSEEHLARLSRELQERNKELRLLHDLAAIGADSSLSLEAALQRIVELLPPAWQHPAETCGRVIVGELEARTANFRETGWRQQSPIVIGGGTAGVVEVFFLVDQPGQDAGPFLQEEQALLDSVARHLAGIIERRRSDDSLCAANQQLEASNQQLRAVEQQLRAYNQQLVASNAALELSEEKYRTLVEGSLQGVMIAQDGPVRLRFANAAMESLSGYAVDELLRMEPSELAGLIHPDDRARFFEKFRSRMAGEPVPPIAEYRILRKDGASTWTVCYSSAIDYLGEPATLTTFVDVSERKRAEEALRRRLFYEKLLAEISALSVEAEDLSAFFERCLALLGERIDVSRVYLFEHDESSNTMDNTQEWCAGGVTPQQDELQGVPGSAVRWWLETLRRKELICYSDIEEIPDDVAREILRPQGILSILVVPLFVRGQYFGFLGLDDCVENRDWLPEDVDILLSISRIVTAVIERKEAEQAALRRTIEVEALYEGARTVLAGTDFESTARRLFDVVRTVTGARAGYIALLSESGEENELLFLESGGLQCSVDSSLPMPIRGLRAVAYETGEVAFDNDFMSSSWASFLPEGHTALSNVLFAPLLIDDQTIGIAGFANKPSGFDKNDQGFAAAMAQLAALGLQKWRAEQLMRSDRDRLQAVMQTAPVALLMTDDQERIVQVNRATEALFGMIGGVASEPLRCGDVIGCVHRHESPKGCGHGEFCSSCGAYRAIRDGLAGRSVDDLEIEIPVETRGVRARRQILLNAAPLRVDNRPGVILAATDITEMRDLHAKMAQSDRLSNMGMLAAGVAHEINNPLSYVLYNLESLTEDLPQLLDDLREAQAYFVAQHTTVSDAEAERLTQTMNPALLDDILARFEESLGGTRRIRDIVRGLGTFSRVERDKLVPVNLMHVIEVAISMAYNEIKYRARLVKEYGRIPTIMASEGRLSQVFLNLLINATHAIEEGDVENNEIRVRTWSEGGQVYAEVRDSGSGIAPENMENLFEPFFSTKEIGGGSGLGLAISKSIIESYGGDISVKSEVGQGTSFILRIPIRATAEATGGQAAVSASSDTARGRILIVDDEEGIRSAMVRMLRGHETVEAANGATARQLLEQDQGFDLILCDMMMPEVSGMDLHQWLLESYPTLAERFIFITGGAFTPKAQEYLRKVDNLRLEKPFDVANFKKIVSDRVIVAKRKRGS